MATLDECFVGTCVDCKRRTVIVDKLYKTDAERKLERIEALARRHNHPGCNTGAQTLAGLIVKICEEK